MVKINFKAGFPSLVTAVLCTNLSESQAIERLNSEHPTGIKSQWRLSDPVLPSGEDNPWPCPDTPGNTHYFCEC